MTDDQPTDDEATDDEAIDEPTDDETVDRSPGDDVDPEAGAELVNLTYAGTAAILVAGAAGAAFPDTFVAVTVAVALLGFAIGVGGLLYGYAVGVARSRTEKITLGGLFWLSGTAPKDVRFRLRLAFGVQVVGAFAAASVRLYTTVAFISLAPMFGLGMLAVWAARHGVFFPKDD